MCIYFWVKLPIFWHFQIQSIVAVRTKQLLYNDWVHISFRSRLPTFLSFWHVQWKSRKLRENKTLCLWALNRISYMLNLLNFSEIINTLSKVKITALTLITNCNCWQSVVAKSFSFLCKKPVKESTDRPIFNTQYIKQIITFIVH